MKLYIIAGEASGDLHGSNLIKSLKNRDENIDIRAWGGDLMEEAGAHIVKHYRDLAFMGFAEVIANLRTILNNIKACKEDIERTKPDAIILIDYPGFNMRIGEWAHERGIKVFYYISPQVWAWKKSRTYKIKKFVDRMFVILPFEKDFYANYDYDVEFVGHPLLDAIDDKVHNEAAFRKFHSLDDKPIITLAPGSRKQEISKMLPMMIRATEKLTNYQVVIAGAPAQEEKFYREFCDDKIRILHGATSDLFKYSKAGLVTSGTATLEAALYKMPQVVCYKGGWISYAIAKRLVNLDYISLVNLIMDRKVVTELIQGQMTPENAARELNLILHTEVRESMLDDYDALHKKLGGKGASQRTADAMLKILNSK